MLSFTRGLPIAAIVGGDMDGKIVMLTKEEEKPDRQLTEKEFFNLLEEEDFQEHQGRPRLMSTRSQHQLRKAVVDGFEPYDEYLLPAYRRIKEKIGTILKKEIKLEPGATMFILPNPTETERVYVAGRSGSGKSFLGALYMNEFFRIFPEKKIYLVTRHQEEKTYEHIPHVEISTEEFAEPDHGYSAERFGPSLVVFDDCDNLMDEKITKTIYSLCDDLISNGRKYGVYCMWLNHQLMDYKKTRNLINEANKVVYFNGGAVAQNERFLQKKMCFSKPDVRKILGLKGRWTMICTSLPAYVVYEHGVFVL